MSRSFIQRMKRLSGTEFWVLGVTAESHAPSCPFLLRFGKNDLTPILSPGDSIFFIDTI